MKIMGKNEHESLEDLIKRFIEFYVRFEEKIAEYTEPVAKLYIDLVQISERISSTLQALYEPFKQLASRLVEIIPKDPETIEKLKLFLDFIRDYETNIYEPAAREGWIIVKVRKLSLNQYVNIGLLARTEPKDLSRYLCDIVNEKEVLDSAYAEWIKNKYFQKREIFWEKGLKAHYDQEYLIAVLLMLPHIEGILKEFFKDFGYHIEGVQRAIGMIKRLEVDDEIETDVKYSAKVLDKGFISLDKQSDKFPHRNAIFHGVDLDFGTEENSAKIIYFLDFLCELTAKPPKGIKGN